jgi:hypothetical protein
MAAMVLPQAPEMGAQARKRFHTELACATGQPDAACKQPDRESAASSAQVIIGKVD